MRYFKIALAIVLSVHTCEQFAQSKHVENRHAYDLPSEARGSVVTMKKSDVCGSKLLRLHEKPHPHPNGTVVDHLIPVELGGSDNADNVWYVTPTTFQMKKDATRYALRAVCKQGLKLSDAQRGFAANWYSFYLMGRQNAR